MINIPRTGLHVLAALLLLGGDALCQTGTQGPIHMVFDCHADPLPQVSAAAKQSIYQQWVANYNWVLDQCEPLGVRVSMLSCGEFMELVVQGGPGGIGAQLLQRIYASNGGQIASHSHREVRLGPLNWPQLSSWATLAQAQQSWQDNISWVNQGILTAFAGSPPEPLSSINCVKGAHLPANQAGYHTLMAAFNLEIRQGGAEEDYYDWFRHHIWHPFRPSVANYMAEDLNGPFVVPTQGSVIGVAGIHHGIFQDMTAPAVKRQFLQLYINWRYRDRHGLPEKVWSWGWGSHPSDFNPASQSRPHMVDVINWLDQHFAHRVEPTGSQVMTWATQRGTAEAYFTWEAAHPGVSSFSFDSLTVDWNEYPWLRAVAEEMADFLWVADLSLAPGVDAYLLRRGPRDAVVLWRDAGASNLDLSALVGPEVRIVGLESGLLYGTDPTSVLLAQEPLIVTEELNRITHSGSPTLGSVIVLEVDGVGGLPAAVYASLFPFSAAIPHTGLLQIAPGPSLTLLGNGAISPATHRFSLPIPIPSDPALLGFTAYVQGVVAPFAGSSLRLTSNAEQIVIN